MPLPDESKASSASSLIKRFQAQIAEDEAPLVPQNSFGSAGRPRQSIPPGGAPSTLGAKLDETRKSLESTKRDHSASLKDRITSPVLPASPDPVAQEHSSMSAPPSAKSEHEDEAEKADDDEKHAVFPTVTKPSYDVPPRSQAPASSVLVADGSAVVAGGLGAKEGLSRPSSPLVETGRLSVPPPSDENSPPPSPVCNSPPPIADSHINEDGDNEEQVATLSELSPIPSAATPRKSTTARQGSVNIPTQASLLKAKPRISSASGSGTSTPASRTTSPTSSPGRPRSIVSSPPLPSSTRMSPNTSRTSTGGTPKTPSSVKTSPALGSSTTMRRQRSDSSASNVTPTSGAGPRKSVPTTGTPRSRAAAAAAAASGAEATTSVAGRATPSRAKTPCVPRTTKTPIPGARSSTTTPSKTSTVASPSAARTSPTATRTSPSTSRVAPAPKVSPTATRTGSGSGAKTPVKPSTSSLGSTTRTPLKTPVKSAATPRTGTAAAKPLARGEATPTRGRAVKGTTATTPAKKAASKSNEVDDVPKEDSKAEHVPEASLESEKVSDAKHKEVEGENVESGSVENGEGAHGDEEEHEQVIADEAGGEAEGEELVNEGDNVEGEPTHEEEEVLSSPVLHEEEGDTEDKVVNSTETDDIPDIPSESDNEEKIFKGFGSRPVGKIGVPVLDDGHGGKVAVGAELLEPKDED